MPNPTEDDGRYAPLAFALTGVPTSGTLANAIAPRRSITPNGFHLEHERPGVADAFIEAKTGTSVVDQAGVGMGTVSDVRDGSLSVEIGPDADRETLSNLRWDGTVNQVIHHLRSRVVSNVSDHVIRLRV